MLAQSIEARCREWICSWNRTDRRCSNFIWVISKFIAYQGSSYIRGLTAHTNWTWILPSLWLHKILAHNHASSSASTVLTWWTSVSSIFPVCRFFLWVLRIRWLDWITFFKDDTCPTCHTSHSAQIKISHSCPKPMNKLIRRTVGTSSSSKLHQVWSDSNGDLHGIFDRLYKVEESSLS